MGRGMVYECAAGCGRPPITNFTLGLTNWMYTEHLWWFPVFRSLDHKRIIDTTIHVTTAPDRTSSKEVQQSTQQVSRDHSRESRYSNWPASIICTCDARRFAERIGGSAKLRSLAMLGQISAVSDLGSPVQVVTQYLICFNQASVKLKSNLAYLARRLLYRGRRCALARHRRDRPPVCYHDLPGLPISPSMRRQHHTPASLSRSHISEKRHVVHHRRTRPDTPLLSQH
jgi:hypothetical protein